MTTTIRIKTFAEFAASQEGQRAIRMARELIPSANASDSAKASYQAALSRVESLACTMLWCSNTVSLQRLVRNAVTE
jgi:hypothetical protein